MSVFKADFFEGVTYYMKSFSLDTNTLIFHFHSFKKYFLN